MAAFAEPFRFSQSPVIRDLREFRASDLEPMLAEEQREWLETLQWDFGTSADLVRKFVNSGVLNGAVLTTAAGIQGYSYFVFEDGKGLIGDLYLVPEHRTAANEELLLNSVLDQIGAHEEVPRIEAQILMLSGDLPRPARRWGRFEVFRRAFLGLHLPVTGQLEGRELPPYLALQLWSDHDQEQGAELIPVTYRGHSDSRINDQYCSLVGARRFLHNIVRFPGCGVFSATASLTAYDLRSGRMCGMVLCSRVAEQAGHITQLCVHPDYQRMGLGQELLRNALHLLEREGCYSVSLTVTTENRTARMLYERLGFRVWRKFAAYVWEP